MSAPNLRYRAPVGLVLTLALAGANRLIDSNRSHTPAVKTISVPAAAVVRPEMPVYRAVARAKPVVTPIAAQPVMARAVVVAPPITSAARSRSTVRSSGAKGHVKAREARPKTRVNVAPHAVKVKRAGKLRKLGRIFGAIGKAVLTNVVPGGAVVSDTVQTSIHNSRRH